jgi:dipeptidyl-peptidase-4
LYRFDKQNPLNADATVTKQLTRGDFETVDVDGIDEASGTVYFTSNQASPVQQQLYSMKLLGGDAMPVSKARGVHASVFPANGGNYFVDTFSSLTAPPSMSLCTVSSGNCAKFWEARSPAAYNLIAPKLLEVKAADGSTTLYGTLLLPPDDVIARNGGKAPLLTNPYGGPGIQSVLDDWGSGEGNFFNQILARDGIAVLTVDNRGQGGRGRDFQSAMLHHMGELPFQDQMAALDQVCAQFKQLDCSRLGWWGWSYGGYMTLYAMTHTDRVKAGVAVAPVTDWRNYDTIYTERYLGLPKEHEDDYRRTSPVNFAANLHGHLLEVHGTSDDNVHLQNTIQMINAFVSSGRRFDLMLYPRKTHSIAGQQARTDLFTRIQALFEKELLGK